MADRVGRGSRRRNLVVLALLLGSGAVTGAWWWSSAAATVAVARVTEEPIAVGFTATGRVRSTRRALVGATAAGRVVRMEVDRGDRLARGAVAAVLESAIEEAETAEARADLAEAEARLDELRAGARREEIAMADERLGQAEVELRVAERHAGRTRRLATHGFVAQQQAEEAEAKVEQTAREVARARDALVLLQRGPRPETLRAAEMVLLARRARLQRAEAARAERTVSSPIAGIVAERHVDPGEAVAPGRPLLLVESDDPAHLEIRAEVEERLIAKVRRGQAALVVPDAGGRALAGRVVDIAPRVDQQRGTADVTVTLDRLPDRRELRPGMTVDVTLVTERRSDATVVPRLAVWTESGQGWAMRVRDGRAERVRVTTGIAADGRLEVVDGLAPGDWVVVAPDGVRIATGQRVVSADGRQ